MKILKKTFLIIIVITVILFLFKNNFIVNKEKILISFSGYTENVLKRYMYLAELMKVEQIF